MNPTIDSLLTSPHLTLFERQKETIIGALRQRNALVMGETGSGKTAMSVFLIRCWLGLGLLDKVLIVAKNEVLHKFRSELLRLIPELSDEDIVTASKENRDPFSTPAKVYIMDYSGFKLCHFHLAGGRPDKSKRVVYKTLFPVDKRWGVILDEVQYIKSHTSDTYKIISKNLKNAGAVLSFSATPVEIPEEVWPIFSVINPTILENSYYWFIRSIGEVMPDTTRILYYYKDGVKRMREKIEPYIFKLKKSEMSELPPKTIQDIEIDLGEFRSVYRDYMENLRKTLVLTRASVAHYITDIYNQIKMPDDRNPRFRMFKSLCKRICPSEKFLVWERSPDVIKALSEWLTNQGIGNLAIFGEVKKEDRVGIIDRFNTDPSIRVLLVSYLTTADSWEIPSRPDCKRSLFYSLPDRGILYAQSMDRQFRINSKAPVTIYRLIMKETIDEWARNLLDAKLRIVEHLMEEKDFDKVEEESYRKFLGIDVRRIMN